MFRHATAVIALAALACPAMAQVTLGNASPTPLETVRVQVPAGSAGAFDEAATRISMANGKITVTLQAPANGSAAPAVDLSLGQFPLGHYDVEVVHTLADGSGATSLGTASFTVAPVLAGSIGPVPAINYSDIWWNPTESGWGLNVIQHGSGVIFATWFVYGADGKPMWYVMPNGAWNSQREYTGAVYRTTGPALGAAFDPSSVTRTQVGYATLMFNFNGVGIQQASVVMNIDRGRIAKLITPQSF